MVGLSAYAAFASRATLAIFALTTVSSFAPAAARAASSVADVDAAARAAGNRPKLARAIGDTLFATSWPAQIIKVRVDGMGAHSVAGLVISGVKFHRKLDESAFLDEIARLVSLTFAHSSVEEVDVWTTVPIATHAHEIVSGDLAMPTSRIVFAVTALRDEVPSFGARLRAGRDVFLDAAWRESLANR